MPDNSEILLEILAEIRPENNFTNSEDFIKDGLLDSMDIVTLVLRLEEEFGISIDGADIRPENFKNLVSLDNLIKKGV